MSNPTEPVTAALDLDSLVEYLTARQSEAGRALHEHPWSASAKKHNDLLVQIGEWINALCRLRAAGDEHGPERCVSINGETANAIRFAMNIIEREARLEEPRNVRIGALADRLSSLLESAEGSR